MLAMLVKHCNLRVYTFSTSVDQIERELQLSYLRKFYTQRVL